VIDSLLKRTERRVGRDADLDTFWSVFVDKFRYTLDKEFQRTGLDGVAEVIHLMRVTDRCKDIWRALCRNDETLRSKGVWSWVRTRKDWRDLVVFSPHVHWAAYGYSMNTDDYYEQSGGWVLKMIRTVNVSKVEGLFYYLIGHAPALERKDKVTYRGCLSAKLLKKISERVHYEDLICPDCGALMVYAALDYDGNITHLTDRTMQRKYVVREYRITGDPPPGLGLTPPV